MTYTLLLSEIDTPNGKVKFEVRKKRFGPDMSMIEYAVYGAGYNGTYTNDRESALERFNQILKEQLNDAVIEIQNNKK